MVSEPLKEDVNIFYYLFFQTLFLSTKQHQPIHKPIFSWSRMTYFISTLWRKPVNIKQWSHEKTQLENKFLNQEIVAILLFKTKSVFSHPLKYG